MKATKVKSATKTKNALKILDKVTGNDKELRVLIAQERVNSRVARLIYEARKEARLTQKQLADRIGTHQSVIARLEDSDYDGHSLSMLQRIADALHKTVHIAFSAPSRASLLTHSGKQA
jgi:ribosome-binding protein aMBF1 (putative translation factor)